MIKNLRIAILINVLAFTPYLCPAQDNAEKLNVKLNGYVRAETFFDTYRSLEGRDGEFYFYPLARSLDATGKDLNKVPQFEMLGAQSRFRVSASGTSAFGAKASGAIEADFLGTTEAMKFQFGLRHAYIKLDWTKTQLLMGQYWHPMSIAEFAPNTVVFACGVAFFPLNRAPQIRLTQQLAEKLKVSGTLLAYASHRAKEPAGTNSQRNSGLPDMQLQIQYGSVSALYFSLTGGYKFLKPYLYTQVNNNKYKATQTIGSYNLQANLGYQFPSFGVKVQGNLGQNLTNYNLIGGYSPITGSQNEKGEYNYSNITSTTVWADFETKGEKIRLGLFAGYSKNLGTKDSIDVNSDLCLDANLSHIYRVAPRVYFISGPVDFGLEYNYTGAVYGTFTGKSVKNTDSPVVNNRILLSVRYTF